MERQTRLARRASTTPLLDRLERMLNKSDQQDQLAGRGRDYAREHGYKRIYLKHTRQRLPKDPLNGRASGPRRARLYARWDPGTGSVPKGRTPDRRAKCARQCCDFLIAVGQELLLAQGEKAGPTLKLLQDMAQLHRRFAPTTDGLRWLVRQLRACHEGGQPPQSLKPAPAQRHERARFLSLGELPQTTRTRHEDNTAPKSARTRRGSWQPGDEPQ